MCQCSNLEAKLTIPGEVETLIKTAIDKETYQSEVLALSSDAQVSPRPSYPPVTEGSSFNG